MPLHFITGAPGSGKTTVSNEMLARGLTVVDTDDQNRTGMSGWHNLKTGEYVAGFNEVEVTQELLDTHVWGLTAKAIEDFHTRSAEELIYLCGRLRQPEPVLAISQHLVFLTVSGETIEQRLIDRSKIPGEVEWGGEAWQREKSIEVNREIEAEYRALGAIMIDAERPVDIIADDIITATSD